MKRPSALCTTDRWTWRTLSWITNAKWKRREWIVWGAASNPKLSPPWTELPQWDPWWWARKCASSARRFRLIALMRKRPKRAKNSQRARNSLSSFRVPRRSMNRSVWTPPKPKKFQYSKDFEKEKKNPRNQWDRASKLHYLRLSKGIRQPSAIEIQANYGEVSMPKRFNKVSRTPGIISNRYGSISNLRLRDEV